MTDYFGFNYDKNNKHHRMIRQALLIVVSLYGFILLWWIVSLLANSVAIPTPLETWDEFVRLLRDGDMTNYGASVWGYVGSSMTTFLEGFAVAFVIAVPLGLLLGYSKDLRDLTAPAIEVLRPIAPIAWAPILILSIDYVVGPVLVVAIGIFFPLLTNTIFGVQKIDRNLTDAAKTLGAKPYQIFYKVMVPSALPYVMNGVKVGLGVGWMCIIAAELYAPSLGGIGNFLSEQAFMGYWPSVYAALILIAVMGLITTGLAEYVHKIITRRMGME